MVKGTSIRVLSGEDVRRALPMSEAIDAMKTAFAELSAGRVAMPVRTQIAIPEEEGTALFMPSHGTAFGGLCVKTVNLFGKNAGVGLPRIQGLVCLFDGETGTPAAVLEGTVLTSLRTGAASGAATDLLARAGSRKAAILGAGVQGRTQLEAVCAVRPVSEARVFDPDRGAAQAFAEEMAPRLDVVVTVSKSSGSAIRGADIVCTATAAKDPVFADGDIDPGTHINAVGSYQPEVREIPGETVGRATLVLDHRESALAETGDIIIPLRQGLIAAKDLETELGDILLGRAPGRSSEEGITLFKSVGVAVQDLAAAVRALEGAVARGLGTVVPL